jgi:uncharacterized membrane protein
VSQLPERTAETSPRSRAIGLLDLTRFVLELFAFASLAVWGFSSWPLPWPGVAFGIGTPLLAVVLWALFLSPRSVVRIDTFARGLIEILIMGGAVIAWASLSAPVVAIVFGVLAAIVGVINGRRELS